MNNLNLINARLLERSELVRVTVGDGRVKAITPMAGVDPEEIGPCLNLAGDWLSLGGVDLQINGALGLAFPDLSPENRDKLTPIGDFLWHQGVDGFLPTIVTTSIANIQRTLATLATVATTGACQMLGVHLEGPFLNPQKRGAHPAEFLLPLTIEGVKRVLGDYASLVRVVTLAPELDSTGQVIPYLRSLGITVSLGHSLATAAQAQQAFDQGARMVTHAFNAMPGLHHREPGLLAAAIADSRVFCGLIADGQHVDPLMVELLLRASGYDRGLFLVSDALAPLGLPDGLYPWDTRQIAVKNGTARLLEDGTLSGTTLPLLVGAENLVRWGCPPERAIALATTAPRTAIGLTSELLGQPAQLLRWHLDSAGSLSWSRLQLG